MIFQRFGTSDANKPYIFVIFHGGGGGQDPCPPLDPRKGYDSKQNTPQANGARDMGVVTLQINSQKQSQ